MKHEEKMPIDIQGDLLLLIREDDIIPTPVRTFRENFQTYSDWDCPSKTYLYLPMYSLLEYLKNIYIIFVISKNSFKWNEWPIFYLSVRSLCTYLLFEYIGTYLHNGIWPLPFGLWSKGHLIADFNSIVHTR